MLNLKRVSHCRGHPGRSEATMHRSNIRVMKMDRNDRSILMRALYADFCANREVGCPMAIWPRSSRSCIRPGPASCRWTMPSSAWPAIPLTICRNERIAAGGYTDARMPRCANSSGQTAAVVVAMIQCQLNWKAPTPVRAFAMSKPSTRKKIIIKLHKRMEGCP